MIKRIRTISNDKKTLNLYIRYMRDYRKDVSFKNIIAIKEEAKTKISLYKVPIQFSSEHLYLSNTHRKLEKQLEQEVDEKKQKNILNELKELKPYFDRYIEIIKRQQSRQVSNKLFANIKNIYDDMPRLDSHPEAYNNIYDDSLDSDGYIQLDNNLIPIQDIKEFEYRIYLICTLFGISMENKITDNILLELCSFQMIENDLPNEYYKYIEDWKSKCYKVDDGINYLIKSKLITKSREVALNLSTNDNAKWLLEKLIQYKSKYKTTISIKQDSKNYKLKALILHQYFKKLFTIKTAENITQNSTLI